MGGPVGRLGLGLRGAPLARADLGGAQGGAIGLRHWPGLLFPDRHPLGHDGPRHPARQGRRGRRAGHLHDRLLAGPGRLGPLLVRRRGRWGRRLHARRRRPLLGGLRLPRGRRRLRDRPARRGGRGRAARPDSRGVAVRRPLERRGLRRDRRRRRQPDLQDHIRGLRVHQRDHLGLPLRHVRQRRRHPVLHPVRLAPERRALQRAALRLRPLGDGRLGALPGVRRLARHGHLDGLVAGALRRPGPPGDARPRAAERRDQQGHRPGHRHHEDVRRRALRHVRRLLPHGQARRHGLRDQRAQRRMGRRSRPRRHRGLQRQLGQHLPHLDERRPVLRGVVQPARRRPQGPLGPVQRLGLRPPHGRPHRAELHRLGLRQLQAARLHRLHPEHLRLHRPGQRQGLHRAVEVHHLPRRGRRVLRRSRLRRLLRRGLHQARHQDDDRAALDRERPSRLRHVGGPGSRHLLGQGDIRFGRLRGRRRGKGGDRHGRRGGHCKERRARAPEGRGARALQGVREA